MAKRSGPTSTPMTYTDREGNKFEFQFSSAPNKISKAPAIPVLNDNYTTGKPSNKMPNGQAIQFVEDPDHPAGS